MAVFYESTGPGRHRYKINARNLDNRRTRTLGFSSGRVLSREEIEHFHRLRQEKEKTPTEIAYLAMLQKREKK